jgi:sphingomyelin phosphodiesterase
MFVTFCRSWRNLSLTNRLLGDLSDPTFQTNREPSSACQFIWLMASPIPATWKLYYSARQTYGPLVGLQPTQSLSPAFWHRVTEAFVTNDAAFQQFVKFQARGVSVPACTGDCKTKTICELRALRAENNCVCHSSVPDILILKHVLLFPFG